ncbi:amino acid permease 6-like isoform X1 [Prunus yedoensis var. nudiflora]|uniref:Amino acid permease 6-like isoform X1 n=1 Tax=Prunus yedoensis var. nudiflora TaxID=2094558 RepID=A0A314Z2A5_PRUYE|nr:amino acid permease 6-like isoform X1 [Prunus yedoensis var. nudiflora]
MTGQFQKSSMYMEHNPAIVENGDFRKNLDDDGRPKRTGKKATLDMGDCQCTYHNGCIGSGVLSLAWAIAQLGWVAGPAVLMAFSFITYFTSTLLADCYRSPDPVHGKRNYTYMDVVRANLGGRKVQLCGLAQYGNLIGVTIGYTITASISMVAVKRSNCFHKHGHHVKCRTSNNPFMIIFACIQILLSQIPNFHKLSWLSILAAVMSFAYSSIGLGLSVAKVIAGPHARTTLTGATVGIDVSASEKVWKTFQAIGDIAFAYAYSTVLVEIQDTLKSPPAENKAMKRATSIGIATTTVFYVLCGCVGYAAFGNDAPGNFLTGFGFYEPFWLVDLANICIAIHLIGAYQVFCQPIFGFVESQCAKRWPESKFINSEHAVNLPFHGAYCFNSFRLVWRTAYVVMTAILAMLFPFFNDFLGLLGAASFWPLTVYFPIEMYIARTKMPRFSFTWTWMKILSWVCLVISLVSAAAAIQGLATDVKKYKPFQTEQ